MIMSVVCWLLSRVSADPAALFLEFDLRIAALPQRLKLAQITACFGNPFIEIVVRWT